MDVKAWRAAAGLAPVVFRADWNDACALHARYPWGGNPHSEDPANPAYTPEGAHTRVPG